MTPWGEPVLGFDVFDDATQDHGRAFQIFSSVME